MISFPKASFLFQSYQPVGQVGCDCPAQIRFNSLSLCFLDSVFFHSVEPLTHQGLEQDILLVC